MSGKRFKTKTSQAANVKGKTHINEPTRRKAPKHESVKKMTRVTAKKKAEQMNAALPSQPAGPQPGSVIAKQMSKPKNVDQFGNPLSPNNDSFFDEGATAQ